MAIKLNHTIILARDKRASAQFLSEMLGLPAPVPFGPFFGVQTQNEVTLDFIDVEGDIPSMHYAFLISDSEFDEIFGRIKARKLKYWADPDQSAAYQINTRDGGRAIYFEDPSGHLLEILTRPYGSGDA